jgi:hypothetical protein
MKALTLFAIVLIGILAYAMYTEGGKVEDDKTE